MPVNIPKNSPRFTELQLVSSVDDSNSSPASSSGGMNSRVLESAFFYRSTNFLSSFSYTSPTTYLIITRPSNICSFIITATISNVFYSLGPNPAYSRPFTQYAFTSGTDVSNSLEYENQGLIPYDTWFYESSNPPISLSGDDVLLELPLKSSFLDSYYLIQGTIKTFVTPTIATP